jgi:hypothetical protein
MAEKLPVEDLERLWTRLAEVIDLAGARRETFLAKLALLLANELGDGVAAERLIKAALEDLD